MNSGQKHPVLFYKYMPASTAKIVLRNKTLRWSHPDKFDDPLDIAKVCDANLDKEKRKQIDDAFIDLAINCPANLYPKTNDLFKIQHSLISLMSDKPHLIEELKRETPEIALKHISELNRTWEEIRKDFRILCLAIEKDNHRLWNDYADGYKGVTIELAARNDSDSPWLVAQPVEYVKEKELFLTVQDWAIIMSLKKYNAVKYLYEKCTLRKVKDNKYKWFEQNEWRIPSFCRNYESGVISDYGVNPDDISAVYFGCHINIQIQREILELLTEELDHVSAFKHEFDTSKKMNFKKIK
ncbi:MAG: hypothetical protein K9M75_06315 [Phycisphaerae bacterium]|nr:hypothetical protein [Phycisphaerae bacterium]